MLSLSAISFAVATTLSGYLASLCFRPPNPHPNSRQAWGAQDSIGPFVAHSASILASRFITFGFCFLHALLTLLVDGGAASPPSHLNLDLFRWSWIAPLAFLSILVGVALRLAAFNALGSRFTFALTKPNELNTRGIYAYIQHPSYTGIVLAVVPVHLLFFRWDGWLSYCISPSILDGLRGWGPLCYAVLIPSYVFSLGLRVVEEEAMLKEVFGEEWIAWNERTKRFIPGLF
ncbi:hypothetical protein E4U42_000770 [Claviceps africana]|uniref:Protein-S-isoprenylcysteine O-methyltransferase n=1 Tax=Claviceps africana TaxID=83212 RepID=A0A8K0JFY2_9HYPO|nr:hypothetical protein E4U42_000770 [Claviceps africana]